MTPGTRIGPYEIVERIGAGGMGEVYRARDPRLGRDVAIKTLPPGFAADPDRLARFEREARTLGTLNHPNIANVFGLESHEGSPCLVMELLDGRSLADVLTAGALPPRKAIDIASQIARGLAAAHDRGVVHRDLKPDNVFVLPDGRVKVLDFGLARQVESAVAAGATLMTRPRGTEPGTVLGTIGYMAPEQVRGDVVDARADLFSLGTVLYEMLTGQQAFRRGTGAETMTAILRDDPPDLATTRPDVSPSVERILRHCLEKNPIERFQTARDVAFALDALSSPSSSAVGTPPGGAVAVRRGRLERLAWFTLAVMLAASVAWLALRGRARSAAVNLPTYRASVILPEGFTFHETTIPALRLALSPDGQRAALVGTVPGSNMSQLWVVSLSDGTTVPLAQTEGGNRPFWSADSRQVAFSDIQARVLRRVPASGGAATRIQDVIGSGTWASDDTIIVADSPPQNRVMRTTTGGAALTVLFSGSDGIINGFPTLLPGGRDLLYTVQRFSIDDQAIDGAYVRSLETGEAKRVLPLADTLNTQYANGCLLFTRGQTLYAQPFDLGARTLTGEPTVLADDLMALPGSGAAFSASQIGTLAYVAQLVERNSRLVWMDRSGHALATVAGDADYSNLQLSPDGRRVAVGVLDPTRRTRDIYLVDVSRGVRQRLTFDPADERSAIWSPDGSLVIYNSRNRDLYQRSADFTGGDTAVVVDGVSKDPRQVSRDGRFLVYRRSGRGNDIWIASLSGDPAPRPLVDSAFDDNYPAFSPDARSIVYASNESGQSEIYAMSIEGGGGKVLVSSGGGSFPRWRADGREIVYLSVDHTIMSVPVSGSGATLQTGKPTPLFRIDPQPGPGEPFDLTADGEHFIVNTAIPSRVPPSLTLLINWPARLRAAPR